MASPDGQYKVVLLGEGRVGKTSLLTRYVKNTFDERQKSTQQASYVERTISVGSKACKLAIWDTAGQEKFHSMLPIYYRGANGVLLVYDITDYSTFEKVQRWVKELHQRIGKNPPIVIAGNKADNLKQRQVTEEQATSYTKSIGARHILTSAKTGEGVSQAFSQLAADVLAKAPQTRMSKASSPLLTLQQDLPKESRSCCR